MVNAYNKQRQWSLEPPWLDLHHEAVPNVVYLSWHLPACFSGIRLLLSLQLELSLQEMHFYVCSLVDLSLGHSTLPSIVRVKLSLSFILLPDVLELIGLKGHHDVLTDTTVSWLQSSLRSKELLRFELGSRLWLTLFMLLFHHFSLLVSCGHLKWEVDLISELWGEPINDFKNVHFSLLSAKWVLDILGSLILSVTVVDLIILGSDAFVLDHVWDTNDHLDCLDEGEKDEQWESDKELYDQEGVKDDEHSTNYDIPSEEFSHVNHLHNLPGLFQLSILTSYHSI